MAAILIIDDEPDYCAVVGRYLESVGHTVSSASSASEIREQLEGPQPDLILMDVRMPDVSGLELLPQLKVRMQGTACTTRAGLKYPGYLKTAGPQI